MNRTFLDSLECRPTHRIPFVPAIYEHKAWFVRSTPSVVCRDADLFTEALVSEFEQIRPDALVVGMDVYNVEAEAAGCPIAYYEGDDTSIPSPVPGQEVYHEDDSVESLKIPEPASDGRMPLMLEVARRVHRLLGEKVPIRGAVSAPFSLAANLAGAQNLFMLTPTRATRRPT